MSKNLLPLACFLAGTLPSVASAQDAESKAQTPKPPAFQVPKDWLPVKKNMFEAARFQVEKGDRIAAVTVTALPPNPDLVANVNRWRLQLGLEPVAEKDALAALKPIKVDGVAGHFLDLTGPDKGDKTQRIQVVMVQQGQNTWFFKLMGPASLVGEQAPTFEAFIQSVRFEK
jgi:hypothetical protein